jgi:hypothetical protein
LEVCLSGLEFISFRPTQRKEIRKKSSVISAGSSEAGERLILSLTISVPKSGCSISPWKQMAFKGKLFSLNLCKPLFYIGCRRLILPCINNLLF